MQILCEDSAAQRNVVDKSTAVILLFTVTVTFSPKLLCSIIFVLPVQWQCVRSLMMGGVEIVTASASFFGNVKHPHD
jgi:hypothetical protein